MSHPVLAQLASSDPATRRAACLAAASDPAATLLTDALCTALGDPVKAVSRAASDALVAIAHQHGDVDPGLRAALHGAEPARRFSAAFTLARISPPGMRLLPALVEALASPDGDVRWAAARLLVDAGRVHGEVFPLLTGLVRSGESPIVRRMATFALRELAPERVEAADALLEAATERDLHVRRAALTAMASLASPPLRVALQLLHALANDADAACRRLAALALGELGAANPDRVPPETRARLEAAGSAPDADADLRRATERALARLARLAAGGGAT
ncbi:MAG TPA: HEAT repeat domain-containing protein [Myxococcota bacterium]